MFGSREKEYLEILEECGLSLTSPDLWWKKYPKRAVEEIYKMQENTHSTFFCKGKQLIWEVQMINDFGSYFLISIETDSGYPFTAPKVFMKDPELEADYCMHVYSDKSLCLFRPEVYSSSMSILDIRNVAASWIHCYEIFLNTGEWAGAEADH
ncbi:MAG: hypothetical protein HON76_08480 [Candidatus Scalindua sp.]|jgi:hypothetical protein|nr:hypothetical protein [Candidatus Scalindua sp.]